MVEKRKILQKRGAKCESSVILSSILGTVLAEIYIEEMTEKNTEEIHVFLKDKTNTQLENKSIILFKKNADEYKRAAEEIKKGILKHLYNNESKT